MNIVLGRPGTGKSTVIYHQIKKCVERGEDDLILIVPEQFTLQAERELIEVMDSPGILSVEVLSFSRLISKLMEEVGGVTRTRLSSTGKYMALQKALLDEKEELTIYGGMVKKPGFVSEIQDMISNLKKRMIHEEDLKKVQEDCLEEYPMLSRKLKDITRLMDRYDQWLGDDYLDSEGTIDLVIAHMGEMRSVQKATIWIDGFDTYTEQMFRFIEQLHIYSKELTITLTQSISIEDRDRDIFLINAKTQKRLMDIGGGQAKLITCHYEQKDKSSELCHLERELYARPVHEYTGEVQNIGINVFKNIYEELDHLCIDLVKLVQEEGYRWRDIVVVTSDLHSYEFLVKRSFEEYKIPFFMDAKRKIMDKPLSILLIHSLKAIAYYFAYEDVFALLKTGLANIGDKDYEILENYVLKYGIRGSAWTKDFTYVDEGDEFDLEALNVMRSAIMDPLLELKGKIRENATFKQITVALYEYMEALSVEEKLQRVLQEVKRYGQYEYAAEIAQIYNVIITLFDEIVDVFGDTKTNINEYLDILESGIENVDLAIIPSSLDQVVVGDMMRTRTTDYKVLFVLGVNEGKLPSSLSDDGLLSENENRVLRERGIEIEEDVGFKSIQEQYLLHNALAKPKDKVIFSYPLADWEGTSLRPSMLIQRFKEVFPRIDVKSQWEEGYAITNERGTIKHMIRHYRAIVDGFEEPGESIWDQVYLWYEGNSDWKRRVEDIKEAMVYDNQVSPLKSNQVKGLYGDKLHTSVTRLEEFTRCPFRHYIHYGLRPKKRRVYEVSIPDIGEALHQLIYEYSLYIEKEKLDWREVGGEQADHICEEIMAHFVGAYKHGIFQTNAKYKSLSRYIYRTFKRSVQVLTYHYKKGKFTVLGNELIFGVGKAIPPLTIELPQEYVLYLEGRIDRVDILKEDDKVFMKVMDFKTGNKDLSLSDIYYGISLQLLVYMWVCLNYGKKKNVETVAAGMFYFKLDDPMVLSGKADEEEIEKEITKSFRLKGLMLKDMDVLKAIDEDIADSDVIPCKVKKNGDFHAGSKGLIEKEQGEQLLSHAKNTIVGIGEEIFGGNISINPTKTKKGEACTYCDYKSICFFDHQLAGSKFNFKPDLSDEEVMNRIGK